MVGNKTDIQRAEALRIWISEDDHDDQFIFASCIKEIAPSAEVRFFLTGGELIRQLSVHPLREPENPWPDLIIGDLKTPFFKIGDIEVIRACSQNKNFPIIIFAESFAEFCPARALELGASAFYHKPNSNHILKDMLLEILDLRKQDITQRQEQGGMI